MDRDELKKIRKELGLTQVGMAVKLGVSAQTVRMWEAGGMKPGKENEKKIKALKRGK